MSDHPVLPDVKAGDYRLPRTSRLCKTDEFSSVFAFRKSLGGSWVRIHFAPNEFGVARLGLVVGKRQARRACDRNRVKRIAREVFRHWTGRALAVDVVVRLATPLSVAMWPALQGEISHLLSRVGRQ